VNHIQQTAVHVVLRLQNMLRSLSGSWKFEPLKIHHTALPASCLTSSSSSSSKKLHALAGKQPLSSCALGFLANSSSSSSSGSSRGGLPAGLCIDAEGNVTATLVQYEQYAQPKGELQITPISIYNS
jgi:hypothetical protein